MRHFVAKKPFKQTKEEWMSEKNLQHLNHKKSTWRKLVQLKKKLTNAFVYDSFQNSKMVNCYGKLDTLKIASCVGNYEKWCYVTTESTIFYVYEFWFSFKKRNRWVCHVIRIKISYW